ncbi:MAG: hypothetical protein IRY90_00390, partial [Actinomadura rubrobrunea]|nr:hypothetical protein [Actinomadura rubrobrunea]
MGEHSRRNRAPYLADGGGPGQHPAWADRHRRAAEPYGSSWDRRRTAVRSAPETGPEGAWASLGAPARPAVSPRDRGAAARSEPLSARNRPVLTQNLTMPLPADDPLAVAPAADRRPRPPQG